MTPVQERWRALWTREPVARALRAAPPLSRFAARRGRSLLRDAAYWEDLQYALRLLAADAATPLVVPAWSGTLADEILYWLPFVRWAVQFAGLPPDRVVLLGPPEHREWYEGLGSTFVATASAAPAGGALLDQEAFLRLCSDFWDGGPIRPVVRHAWYESRPRRPAAPVGESAYLVVDVRTRLPSVDVVELPADSPLRTVDLVAGASGAIGPWGDVLALALLHGVPSVLLVEPGDRAVEPHVDVAQRYARLAGSSLTVVDPDWLRTPAAAAVTTRASATAIRLS